MYSDIKATINDPLLETYAPPLPHLGTTSDRAGLFQDSQLRIIDSGTRLLAYLDTQLILLFPPKKDAPGASDSSKDPSTNINIENFQGILGDVHRSTISQNLTLGIEKGQFPALSQRLSELGVPPGDIDELQHALESEPVAVARDKFGAKVAAWIGKMVQKAATGLWDISVNTAGSVLALLLSKYYGF
jgi:hypothetical protein